LNNTCYISKNIIIIQYAISEHAYQNVDFILCWTCTVKNQKWKILRIPVFFSWIFILLFAISLEICLSILRNSYVATYQLVGDSSPGGDTSTAPASMIYMWETILMPRVICCRCYVCAIVATCLFLFGLLLNSRDSLRMPIACGWEANIFFSLPISIFSYQILRYVIRKLRKG
jgi:hypothetical protein